MYGAIRVIGNSGLRSSGRSRWRHSLEGDDLVEYGLYGRAQSVKRDVDIGEFFSRSGTPCVDGDPCHRTPVPQNLEEEVVDERHDGHEFESVFPKPEPGAF